MKKVQRLDVWNYMEEEEKTRKEEKGTVGTEGVSPHLGSSSISVSTTSIFTDEKGHIWELKETTTRPPKYYIILEFW